MTPLPKTRICGCRGWCRVLSEQSYLPKPKGSRAGAGIGSQGWTLGQKCRGHRAEQSPPALGAWVNSLVRSSRTWRGTDKALALQEKGLEAIREHKETDSDPLEPTWGEPELLMSLAWSNLNRTTPDLKAAEQYAQGALKLVPYWHYVRDILIPQIRASQVKAARK